MFLFVVVTLLMISWLSRSALVLLTAPLGYRRDSVPECSGAVRFRGDARTIAAA